MGLHADAGGKRKRAGGDEIGVEAGDVVEARLRTRLAQQFGELGASADQIAALLLGVTELMLRNARAAQDKVRLLHPVAHGC